MEALDGRLFKWLDHLFLVRKLVHSNILQDTAELYRAEADIIALIKNARKAGFGWYFSKKDISYNKDGSGYHYILPSCSLAGYLQLQNNNSLESYFKKRGHGKGIDWDTESGAWFPRFKTRRDAERVIAFLNKQFDRLYLK